MGSLVKLLESEFKKIQMVDNKLLRVERRPEGCKLNLNSCEEDTEFSSGSTAIPAIITGSDGINYSIALYANGYDEDPTGSGTMQILDLNLSESLSIGAKILAFESIITVINSEEE